ncbi:MAG: flavin oxidoreductase, partial [Phototrophicales bacterium]
INPNRVVTLVRLLQLAPQITIVCSNPGAKSLRNLLETKHPEALDQQINLLVMKGEETLDLGREHTLEFIPTPNPRYPDQLCTYDPRTEVMYTDKLFGAHVCGDQVLDEGWTVYGEDRRYYFDSVMAPYARQVGVAID